MEGYPYCVHIPEGLKHTRVNENHICGDKKAENDTMTKLKEIHIHILM